MLPALPTGMQSASSGSPSSSRTSNAAVFWPSIRNGLTELTSSIGWLLGELADELERLVEVAAQRDHARAVHQRLGELAGRDLALGDDHRAAQPGARRVGGGARGGVAGRGADHRLGALAHGAARRRTVIPRSLNEPVGFAPSNFSQTSAPTRSESARRVARAASSPRCRRHDRDRPARTAGGRGSARSGRACGLSSNSSSITRIARGARAQEVELARSARSAA